MGQHIGRLGKQQAVPFRIADGRLGTQGKSHGPGDALYSDAYGRTALCAASHRPLD